MCAVLAHVGKTEFMMGEKMWKPALILFLTAGLSGCEMEQALMEQPKSSAKPSTEKSSTTPFVGSNCELKNPAGTGTCEDGRNPQSPKSAATAATANFDPADCKKQGFAAVGMVNALFYSGQLGKFQEFCRSIEGGSAPAAPARKTATQKVVTDDGTGGGTWYCDDRIDGAGNYGVWEMTLQTDRFYNCKKVD